MRIGLGVVLSLAAVIAAASAHADNLKYEQIPEHMAGKWTLQAASACAKPALIISREGDGFRFTTTFPVQRTEILVEGIPPPRVVGSPPTFYFERPKPAANKPRYIDGAEIRMPSPDILDASFPIGDGKYVPFARYTRCSDAAVG
jgi:hypothetical protein